MSKVSNVAYMISEYARVSSPKAVNSTHNFIYFFPRSEIEIDGLMRALTDLGFHPNEHLSTLNNKAFPIVRVPESMAVGKFCGQIRTYWKETLSINPHDIIALKKVMQASELHEGRDADHSDEYKFWTKDAKDMDMVKKILANYGFYGRPHENFIMVISARGNKPNRYLLAEIARRVESAEITKAKSHTFDNGTGKIKTVEKANETGFLAKFKGMIRHKQKD